jgi:aminocarboxymuconate-semialdehyde decarboxylase
MPIIDVHNHFYPPAYLEALRSGGSAVAVTIDEDGDPCVHYPGDYNVAVRGHRDLDYREQVLIEAGVDTQVLTLTTPGTHVETPALAARLASLVNDAFAAAVQAKPGRFWALATLPLNDPGASARELERAWTLGLPGAMLFSNVNGAPLYDERFWPIYERANDCGAVLHIHPTNPASVEGMREYWLMPLVSFLFDTTLAAAGLVFHGVVERFPRIRWLLSHLGGAIPYTAERLDRGFEAFAECRRHIRRPPSEYLKTHFYYDTVNFDTRAIELALAFAGASHLMAGSDYPHQVGSIPKMLESLRSVRLTEAERADILASNAARLFRGAHGSMERTAS